MAGEMKKDWNTVDSDRRLVLGVAGSARKQGNSATLLEVVLNELRAEFRTETVFLVDCRIEPCQGCHYCEQHGSCKIGDDMPRLWQEMLRADVVILAAPSYMGGLTSRMQAFMERTWPLRKGRLAGKVGGYIVVGRRRIGMATGIMEEYFTRLGMLKLPGVVGYAFEPGQIAKDEEAMRQSRGLAGGVRRALGLADRT